MALKTVTKQQWEQFYIAGSILKNQEANEVVVLAPSRVKCEDKDGNDVTSRCLDDTTKALATDPDGDYTNNGLKIRFRNGKAVESPYIVAFRMVTNLGNHWEVDMKVKIKEVGNLRTTTTTTTTTTS